MQILDDLPEAQYLCRKIWTTTPMRGDWPFLANDTSYNLDAVTVLDNGYSNNQFNIPGRSFGHRD